MSGIVGILNRNGAPVAKDVLGAMNSVAAYRGCDGSGSWVDGFVGLSQLLLLTTPEALEEHMPMLDPASGLCIVFDGRIDNREELSDALEARGVVRRTVTDMELVLKGYEAWGASCVGRLLGDFAFAIWNRRKQELFCARDIKGFRPFFYSLSGAHFIFASEARQIFQHPDVQRRVNVGMAAEYLANTIHSLGETLYTDVMRLPPAHYLLVDKDRVELRQYWDCMPKKPIRYKNDNDYVEHYLALLRQAVDCRLRSSGRVGVTMSGGLDSTSVAGMAQKIYTESGRQQPIIALSSTLPGRDADESEAIQQMVDMWALDSCVCPFTSFAQEMDWSDQVASTCMLPDNPLTLLEKDLMAQAHAREVKVVLSGMGADGILGGSSYPYLQALLGCEWRFLSSHFHLQVKERGWKTAGSRLLRSLLWPIVPRSLRKLCSSLNPVFLGPGLLAAEFLKSTQLAQRLRQYRCEWQFRDLEKWKKYSSVFNAATLFNLELEEPLYAQLGMEQRHPFCDRRLMEFAMAIPDFQNLKNGQRKRLILEGSRDLIPRQLQKSVNHGHFGNAFQEALKLPVIGTTLQSLQIADAGWVVQKQVDQKYAEVMQRSSEGMEIHVGDYRWLTPLWGVFSFEMWVREAQVSLPPLQLH